MTLGIAVARVGQGYEIFGFSRDGTATVYREWAPTAKAVHLIGLLILPFTLPQAPLELLEFLQSLKSTSMEAH